MFSESSITTTQLLSVFSEEIVARGGQVSDTFHDGARLFVRSILPQVKEVRPGDQLQGGVALKACGDSVCLYPYVFRLVCRNGAIMAETLSSRRLEDLHLQEPETVLQTVREGIEACCAREVFLETVGKMRQARDVQADFALTVLPWFSRLSTGIHTAALNQILERFFQDGDSSQFGLANAVTAVARDTRDPEARWNLEEFGGGIAVGTVPPLPVDGGRAARQRPRETVAVG
jgi:hypothetical protein